ncbi:metallophosphoesterase [candidate division KSB1 bacterium]|nr:metallophosphoesterase [candidate division KSB1 bacterium]
MKIRLNHFQLWILFCGIYVASFLTVTAQTKDNGFRFVFMTDIHLQTELNGDVGFQTAIQKVNTLSPDFVITGGDLIMDALEANHEQATNLYDLYLESCEEFEMPVHNTIGNHEVFGLYENSGVSQDHPEYGKTMFKNRIGNGQTYRSFDHMGWHFILLDGIGFTEDRHYTGEIDSVQLTWIKSDLSKVDKETPIVISTHIPLMSVMYQRGYGGTAALPENLVIEKSNEILALFDGYNLKLVLQGHLHIVEEIIFYDVHYITGGAVCGSWWNGPRAGFPEGFVVVDVQGDDFSWTYETYGWVAKTNE